MDRKKFERLWNWGQGHALSKAKEKSQGLATQRESLSLPLGSKTKVIAWTEN